MIFLRADLANDLTMIYKDNWIFLRTDLVKDLTMIYKNNWIFYEQI